MLNRPPTSYLEDFLSGCTKDLCQVKTPPSHIDNARVLRYAIIDERCTPTGACDHRVLGDELPMGPAAGLAICRYPEGSGYYLFYCDEAWAVQSDGYHDSGEEAERQAEFEYTGVSDCWIQAKLLSGA